MCPKETMKYDPTIHSLYRRPGNVDDSRGAEEQGPRLSREETPHEDAQPAVRGHFPVAGEAEADDFRVPRSIF